MVLEPEQSFIKDTDQMLKWVENGTFAFIADGVVNEYYASQHCSIESIDQGFQEKSFAFGFPRGEF